MRSYKEQNRKYREITKYFAGFKKELDVWLFSIKNISLENK